MNCSSIVVASFSLLAGCGGSSSASNGVDAGVATADDVGDSGLITCQNDARVSAYTAGMAKSTTSGRLTYSITSADPSPPARGVNGWTIRVTDATGTPKAGLAIDVLPFMPDHGHGSSVEASVTANPDGSYTVGNLYFFMAGVWRVTFSTPSGAGTESVDFFFCVPG